MVIELHPSTTDRLVRIRIPASISDRDAVKLLRSCGERWPSRLSIPDSMSIFLEIETRATEQGADAVRNAVEQLWTDLARVRALGKATSPDLEGLVSAVIERSLGKP